MQNHAYNAIKMRGYTMRTGRFTRCYICSFLCVLRARLEQTNYLMITQGGKKQRKSISLESWETASRITTDYLSNWRCVPTITALWPSLDQPSLLQHPTKCTSDYRKISWPTVTNWPADKHRSGNKQQAGHHATQYSKLRCIIRCTFFCIQQMCRRILLLDILTSPHPRPDQSFFLDCHKFYDQAAGHLQETIIID